MFSCFWVFIWLSKNINTAVFNISECYTGEPELSRKLLLLNVNKLFIVLLKELHFQCAVHYALFILHFFWCKWLVILISEYIRNRVIETLSKLPMLQNFFFFFFEITWSRIASRLFKRNCKIASESFWKRSFYIHLTTNSDFWSL